MANPEVKLQSLLRQHRFKLVRQNRHLVFQNPDGRVYVMASTPSDYRAAHNQLVSLKRCLAAPPVPMVLAISEFERQEAAAIIQAAPRRTAGVSSGKHHRSTGTGYKYEDKVLTAEQLAEREKLAEVARAAAARREQQHQERRARKLAQRAEKAEQKAQAEQEFQMRCSVFLERTRETVEYADARFLKTCQVMRESRMWTTDAFYEFATTEEGKRDEKVAKECIRLFVLDEPDEKSTLEDLDFFRDRLLDVAQAENASSIRVEKVMRFVEKRLRQEPDVLGLLWDMHREIPSIDWSDFTGYGHLCVMCELFSELRSLILDCLWGESPDRLAAVICKGERDNGEPDFWVLSVDEGKDNELGNPVRGIPPLNFKSDDAPEHEQVEETTVNDEDAVVGEILALARGEAA